MSASDSLPEQILASSAIVALPTLGASRLVAPCEVFLQEGLCAFTVAGDQCRAIRDLSPVFDHRAAFGVRDVDAAEQIVNAKACGAHFVLAGRVDYQLVRAANEAELPICLPALTPTEIDQAWMLGIAGVQLVPARAMGPDYAEDIGGLFPDVPLIAGGPLDHSDIVRWIAAGCAAAVLGGPQVDNLLQLEDLTAWRALGRSYAETIRSHRSA